jgi:hypothetical protein
MPCSYPSLCTPGKIGEEKEGMWKKTGLFSPSWFISGIRVAGKD